MQSSKNIAEYSLKCPNWLTVTVKKDGSQSRWDGQFGAQFVHICNEAIFHQADRVLQLHTVPPGRLVPLSMAKARELFAEHFCATRAEFEEAFAAHQKQHLYAWVQVAVEKVSSFGLPKQGGYCADFCPSNNALVELERSANWSKIACTTCPGCKCCPGNDFYDERRAATWLLGMIFTLFDRPNNCFAFVREKEGVKEKISMNLDNDRMCRPFHQTPGDPLMLFFSSRDLGSAIARHPGIKYPCLYPKDVRRQYVERMKELYGSTKSQTPLADAVLDAMRGEVKGVPAEQVAADAFVQRLKQLIKPLESSKEYLSFDAVAWRIYALFLQCED